VDKRYVDLHSGEDVPKGSRSCTDLNALVYGTRGRDGRLPVRTGTALTMHLDNLGRWRGASTVRTSA
jgi:hypothetical protein